ncbi:MAG: flagellar biosynthetic protein FliP, partial [Synergistales bacterium]|nr:flagellar biosynthetic protein FliP [Synergistales bacterium]
MVILVGAAYAQPEPPVIPVPSLEFGIKAAQSPQDVALTLQILALLTVLSLAPAIVLMLTSFTRILVVLSFVRSAIGVQQMPSNQILV